MGTEPKPYAWPSAGTEPLPSMRWVTEKVSVCTEGGSHVQSQNGIAYRHAIEVRFVIRWVQQQALIRVYRECNLVGGFDSDTPIIVWPMLAAP